MVIVSTAFAGLSLLAVAAGPLESVEAPRPAAGVRLEYHFHEGDVLRIEVEESSRLLAVKGDARQEQSNNSTTENRYVVTSVSSEGVATLRYRIEAAQMELRFDNGEPVRFDSSQQETPPAFASVRRQIGKDRLELDVRPNGTVVEIRPLIGKSGVKSKPGEADHVADAAKTTPDIFPVLPERPLRVGEEWTELRTMRVGVGEGLNSRLTQEVRILHSFCLESYGSGVAVIAFKSAPLGAIDDPTIQLQVAPQKASGTIRFDVARGRLLERTTEVDNLTIGWQGPDSSLKTRQTRTERLVRKAATVSSRE